jgi:hypothetical protein
VVLVFSHKQDYQDYGFHLQACFETQYEKSQNPIVRFRYSQTSFLVQFSDFSKLLKTASNTAPLHNMAIGENCFMTF